jgi:hypothetical protein
MRHTRARLLCALLATAPAAGARGQSRSDSAAARARVSLRPLASLALPGAGQLLAHEDRAAVYFAAELYTLNRYLSLRAAGRHDAQRFRALAFQVARRAYASSWRDTVFEYYEQMERFVRSGAFDTDPGPGVAPEVDPRTYNGSVWLLARRTFWQSPDSAPPPTSPEYQRALQFYEARAVGPEFLWSWQNSDLEWQEYRATIGRSDNAFRRAQNQLGLLLANHVVSTIDALVSARLAALARRPARLETQLSPNVAWRVTVAF